MFGRDEQQLPRIGREHLVLPEDPTGEVRQHAAGLHAGQPGADRVGERARLLVTGEPGDQRADHLAQARRC